MAKLFNVILTKRFDNFLQDNALINRFTKKARTDDHMFVLRTLIEKYTKDNVVNCLHASKHLIQLFIILMIQCFLS